ncbi:DUF421 domain-containing protein [Alkaliphilus transvaalensis]|uniref:DUF421 domain-containing protein n=1 Tax=Alkaliphilus transvaalensis TaxID=114628 RepID=UPI00047E2417|nr:DUF421 domain-containing protein [Alkaliphilus transvaalensis]
MHIIWESLLMVFTGTALLRITGRKSISQMTVAQTVIMISIGNIIVQPIIETSPWRTIVAASIFIIFLIIVEYLQVNFNLLENILTGKGIIVILNGQIVPENLRKLRFTVDQLEMRLRQQGITNISDVKTGTLEPNGQLGYELMPHAKPVTIGELQKMFPHLIDQNYKVPQDNFSLFTEVKDRIHENENQDHLK